MRANGSFGSSCNSEVFVLQVVLHIRVGGSRTRLQDNQHTKKIINIKKKRKEKVKERERERERERVVAVFPQLYFSPFELILLFDVEASSGCGRAD